MADEQEQLPTGVVPFTDVLSGQAPSPMARSGERTWLSQVYSAVADPVTAAVRYPFELAGKLDVASGIKTPEQAERRAGLYSRALVPQTPAEAAIDAVSLGGGRVIRPVSKLLGAGARIAATTGAGALVGAVSDEGALSGGLKGLTAGALSEGTSAVINRLRKTGTERVVMAQQTRDAADTGQLLEQLPPLKGVFNGQRTPEQLYDLAYGAGKTVKGQEVGKGVALLKDAQDVAEGQITSILNQQAQQTGRGYRYPDAMNPGSFTTWDEARKALSTLGDLSRRLKPQQTTTIAGKTYNGGEVKQLFAETQRLFQSQLSLADPSGRAVQLFNDSRAQYAAGLKMLDMLKRAFDKSDPERIVFNTSGIQNWLRKNQVSMARTFGDDGLVAINDLITRGAGPGRVDKYAPTGLLSSLTNNVPFVGPAAGKMLGMPRLAGDPRALSQPIEAVIRGGMAQGSNAALNAGIPGLSVPSPQLFDPANPTGGIPGLK